MADAAPPANVGAGQGERSPLLPGDGTSKTGADGTTAGAAPGKDVHRSVSWVLLSFLILGEIAGQGVFALPLHLGRLGWL